MTAPDRRGSRFRLLALAALPIAGCALLESLVPPAPPWAVVRGVRSATPPTKPVRRVLVLPFTTRDAVPAHAGSMRVAFAQVLRDACGFDVVSPDLASLPRTTRDELLAGAGRDAAALIRLRREWEADAVLHGQLAFSRPHGEPAVGLEVELVDARDGQVLWSAQDAVDARDPAVRASLLEFRRGESGVDPEDVTQMPFDSFTRFVARSFARTLFAPPPAAMASEVPGKAFPVVGVR